MGTSQSAQQAAPLPGEGRPLAIGQATQSLPDVGQAVTATRVAVQALPWGGCLAGILVQGCPGYGEVGYGLLALLSPVLQFQGQWFVLGLASNTYRREDRALLNTFSTTFGLNQKGHFEVSNTMTRGKRCNTWSYVLIPAAQPGHFTVDTKAEADPGGRAGTGTFSEDVQVVDGDYTVFALLLSIRRMGSQTTIRISLLGRHWNLPRWTLDRFTCLVKAQGLTKDNIVFPTAIGNSFTGSGQWEMESRQAGQGLPEDPRLISPAPTPEQAGSTVSSRRLEISFSTLALETEHSVGLELGVNNTQ
ncbi:epididymal-specific lipocalin-12 [Urocitellus parryii]